MVEKKAKETKETKKTTKKTTKATKSTKEEPVKRYANFTFIEDKDSVDTELSTLGFKENASRLVTYLCMGVALAGQTYKVEPEELTQKINDFYQKFVEANENKEEK